MAEIFNEQPGAGFNPAPRTDEQNAALINAIKAQSGAFGKNKSNFGLTAGLRSAFDLEGPESLGIMAQIPSLVNSSGDKSAFPRSSAIKALNLDPETERMYLEKTQGSESLTVPSMFENMSFGPEGNFLGGLELGGGNLTSPSGIEFERVSGGNDNLETIMAELEAARREVKDSGVLPRFDQEVIEGSGKGLSTKNIEKVLEAEAAEIDALLGNNPVFDNPMGDIESLIEQAKMAEQSLKEEERLGIDPPKAPTIASMAEDDRTGAAAQEQNQIDQAKKSVTEDDDSTPAENGFVAAMADYTKRMGKEAPKNNESKKDAIARYRKEFEEATGLDASGEIDKKRALMAFGLNLMQNQVGGKGFSGAMSALGGAGEVYAKELDKSRSESRAAGLAAGQYALNQRKADVTAERAAISASAKFKNDLYLKFYDSSLKREENLLKSRLTIEEQMAEAKAAGKDFTKVDGRTYAVGQGSAASWEVKYVYDSTDPNGGFLLKPENAIKKHIQGREGVTDARDLIVGLRGAAKEISEGGGSQAFIYDKLLSFGKAVMPATYLTGQPTNVENYDKGVKSILAEFKRFLTQETGNGISNKDVQMWEEDLMGNLSLFSNLDATNAALDKLDRIFYRKEAEFNGALEELLDPTNHEQSTRAEILRKFGTYKDLQGQGDLVFVDGKIQRIEK